MPLPLRAQGSGHAPVDPLTLVPIVFHRAYITGWSAAEYWNLTEQIFGTVVVFTSDAVRRTMHQLDGVRFLAKHKPLSRFFGTQAVWRETVKVDLADATHAVLDMIEDPSVGGGIDHVFSCLLEYTRSEHFDDSTLLKYVDRMKNGAICKRLGFLLSKTELDNKDLLRNLQQRLTTGFAKLDPQLNCPQLVREWKVKVPDAWHSGI